MSLQQNHYQTSEYNSSFVWYKSFVCATVPLWFRVYKTLYKLISVLQAFICQPLCHKLLEMESLYSFWISICVFGPLSFCMWIHVSAFCTDVSICVFGPLCFCMWIRVAAFCTDVAPIDVIQTPSLCCVPMYLCYNCLSLCEAVYNSHRYMHKKHFVYICSVQLDI